jgi:hypothetical protein
MEEGGIAGLALVLLGVLVICQVTKGAALTRLGIVKS